MDTGCGERVSEVAAGRPVFVAGTDREQSTREGGGCILCSLSPSSTAGTRLATFVFTGKQLAKEPKGQAHLHLFNVHLSVPEG